MISTRLFKVQEEIRKRHGQSIGEVMMCFNSYSEDLIERDMSKTLRDCGVASACDVLIYYDFKPVSTPMLTSPFSYRTGKEGTEQS